MRQRRPIVARKTFRSSALAAVVLAAGLGLAACGSDDSGDKPSE